MDVVYTENIGKVTLARSGKKETQQERVEMRHMGTEETGRGMRKMIEIRKRGFGKPLENNLFTNFYSFTFSSREWNISDAHYNVNLTNQFVHMKSVSHLISFCVVGRLILQR